MAEIALDRFSRADALQRYDLEVLQFSATPAWPDLCSVRTGFKRRLGRRLVWHGVDWQRPCPTLEWKVMEDRTVPDRQPRARPAQIGFGRGFE